MTQPQPAAPATAMAALSRPARVLFAHNSSEIGGGNRVLLGLIDHLPRDRFEPLSLVPGRGPLELELHRRRVRTVRVDVVAPLRRRSSVAQATVLARLVATLGWRRIDLLHANGPLSYRLPALALRDAARLCHLHLAATRDSMRWAFRSPPDVVVACSEGVRRQAAADLGPGAMAPRVVAHPNAVDLDHWSPSPDLAVLPPLPPLPEHDALVLFMGSLAEQKGLRDYLRLAAGVLAHRPRSLFVVAGDDLAGAGAHRLQMEELARSQGLGDRVRFTGFLADPRPLLHAATLVVLPSSSEGMPMALLEAAACRKPVLAYRIPGVDEVVDDGVDGRLLPLGDVDGLVAATLDLLARPELAAEMGRRGRQRVEAHHDARRYAERMTELYDDLLARRRESPRRDRRSRPAPSTVDPVAGRASVASVANEGVRWHDRYADPVVVERYLDDRFSSPLGSLLHARQAAVLRRTLERGEHRRVLEVAAGPARFARDLEGRGRQCVFVDRSLPMLRAARRASGGAAATSRAWIGADAFALPFRDASFDAVLAFRFLRHLDAAERARCYDELARLLRPRGVLIFDAINERVSAPLRSASPGDYPLPDQLYTEASLRAELARTRFVLGALEPVQRRYALQRRLQILLAPRSRRLAVWAIGAAESWGGAPLEWVVLCRRA